MRATPAIALGYQGFGNLGDEAILTGLEAVLRGSSVQVRAVVCGPEPVAGFPDARRLRTRRMRPTAAALRALRRSGVLIISGGGLLHDHWRSVVPTYLLWSLLARALGVRVAWVGVGIGPLERPFARRLAGWTLRLASLVSVRDEESARLAGEIAPGLPVHLVADPSVHNPTRVANPRAERGGLAVIVRGPAPRDAGRTAALAQALADAAGRAAGDGLGPATVLTFGGPADQLFAARVAGLAATAGTPLSIEPMPPDPAAAIAALSRYTAVVTVRLHGMLLAAMAGTPAVAIAYDPKVTASARRLGMEDQCIALADVSAERILAALDRGMRPDAVAVVADRLAALRATAPELRGLIEATAR
jgi:polysaccharide pyruvyl transferase CsaB